MIDGREIMCALLESIPAAEKEALRRKTGRNGQPSPTLEVCSRAACRSVVGAHHSVRLDVHFTFLGYASV